MANTKLLLARVLVAFFDGGVAIQPNALVQGDADVIKALEKANTLDSNAKAVAYCKAQGAEPIEITGEGVVIEAKKPKKKLRPKAAALAAEAAKAKEGKINNLTADKAALEKELGEAADADKPGIQTKIDDVVKQLKDLEAE